MAPVPPLEVTNTPLNIERDSSMTLPDNHSFKSLEDFVVALGGTTPIKKVLISNNGIAAVKFIRSMRKWAYETFGDENEVLFVGMATPEDMGANAEYIRMADEVAEVPGGSNNNNYANVSLIVELAEQYDVDAVWAGWGHASENPLLPDALDALGRRVVFIGPSSGPMRALGDKIGSTIIAQSARVATIPWNGDGIIVDFEEDNSSKGNISVPEDLYERANLRTVEQCKAACELVGFPLMIKASEGGGGKGIRKVLKSEDVETSFRQVQGEIPGSPIFVMKLASGARHLEVQLLADNYGEAISLSGRDCSVQRRHQKIIEEGPPLAPAHDVWREMEAAAVRLAKAVGYVNAGTVEYLFMDESVNRDTKISEFERTNSSSQKFAFLELNPRLQVEHPVTEMITGVNLPAAQFMVALGIPLHRIPDIRMLYGKRPYENTPINFSVERQILPGGHVIAARITAENPDQDFQPTSGAIRELNFRSTKDVWGYFSVDSSGAVHEFADSQIGHLFASGTTREEARKHMVRALKEFSIRGDIRTTVEYLVDLMSSKDFVENRINTAWLDNRIRNNVRASKPDAILVVLCAAAVKSFDLSISRQADFEACCERGQLPPKSLLRLKDRHSLIYLGTKYIVTSIRSGECMFSLTFVGDHETVDVSVRALADGGRLVGLGGKSHVAYGLESSTGFRLVLGGFTCTFSNEYDPSNLRATTAGKLARFLVEDGAHVKAGDAYAELEVMKMYLSLIVPESGRISMNTTEGAVLEPGDLLATLVLDDPSKVKKAALFKDEIPVKFTTNVVNNNSIGYLKPHHLLRSAVTTLGRIMAGYGTSKKTNNGKDITSMVALLQLQNSVKDPLLSILELEEAMAVLSGRLPAPLTSSIQNLLCEYRSAVTSAGDDKDKVNRESSRLKGIRVLVDQHAAELDDRGRQALLDNAATLISLSENGSKGPKARLIIEIANLLANFVETESQFDMVDENPMKSLRVKYASKLGDLYSLVISNNGIMEKKLLVHKLLKLVGYQKMDANVSKPLIPVFGQLARLKSSIYAEVALDARQALMIQTVPTSDDTLLEVKEYLQSHSFTNVINNNNDISWCLTDTFKCHKTDPILALAAMETYLRRCYRPYEVLTIETSDDANADRSGMLTGIMTFRNASHDAIFVGDNAISSDKRSRTTSTGSIYDEEPQLLKQTSYTNTKPKLKASRSFDSLDSLGAIATSYSRHRETNGTTSSLAESHQYIMCDSQRRTCAAAFASSFQQLLIGFDEIIQQISTYSAKHADLHVMDASSKTNQSRAIAHVLHVIMPASAILEDISDSTSNEGSTGSNNADGIDLRGSDNAAVKKLEIFLQAFCDALDMAGVRRVTFNLLPSHADKPPRLYTFRHRIHFREDPIVRHTEPTLAYHLELHRLVANYHINAVPTKNRVIHIYKAKQKNTKHPNTRYFVRALIRMVQPLIPDPKRSHQRTYPGLERMFVESLNALEKTLATENAQSTDRNSVKNIGSHSIFLNILPNIVATIDGVVHVITAMYMQYGSRIRKLGMKTMELRVMLSQTEEQLEAVPFRFVAVDPTGYNLEVDVYAEANDGAGRIFTSMNKSGPLNGLSVRTPYPETLPLEQKRATARSITGCVYCYDLLELFHQSVLNQWRSASRAIGSSSVSIPEKLMTSVELVLDDAFPVGVNPKMYSSLACGGLRETKRLPGENNIGMVAWRITLHTPEYVEGRIIYLIANDITFKVGSFGTAEDELFHRVSQLARREGLPRLYCAANSGARIGVANEVKKLFRVGWNKPGDYSRGFEYLYVTAADRALLGNSIKTRLRPKSDNNEEERWEITSIIGKDTDLGVENLRGSGTIAGETSRAYRDTFTLTYVNGRCVGIGAYLVRLGQRTIQRVVGAPILLTGYKALNKLIGQPVYSSNDQIGGPDIMVTNGITHHAVSDDLEGIMACVEWLSYVPKCRGSSVLPLASSITSQVDPIERCIDFQPTKTAYDPRLLLSGYKNPSGGHKAFVSGFFDKGSVSEKLAGWAKTVVVAHARLGGIPVGVIISETRTVQRTTPADPAAPNSGEMSVHQAGQVWFPDSAYKTSQAINDFNGEGLPLMIFANWRGFSGGQRDMFDEVLKYGALIVDALVKYKQPVFIYIPPFAELRGGAWVVVDSTVNAEMMEMYAAPGARGGVLEPSGAVSIKFRDHDLRATASRLDNRLQKLRTQLKDPSMSASRRVLLEAACREREEELLPVYRQIAHQFADLHDRPGRMRAKGVIRAAVPWKRSRVFFYWRLRRRLLEQNIVRQIVEAKPGLSDIKATAMLSEWCGSLSSRNSSVELEDEAESFITEDKRFVNWLIQEKNVLQQHIASLRQSHVKELVHTMGLKQPIAAVDGLLSMLQHLPSAQRDQCLAALRRGVIYRSSLG